VFIIADPLLQLAPGESCGCISWEDKLGKVPRLLFPVRMKYRFELGLGDSVRLEYADVNSRLILSASSPLRTEILLEKGRKKKATVPR